jgi:hypothetical protein
LILLLLLPLPLLLLVIPAKAGRFWAAEWRTIHGLSTLSP